MNEQERVREKVKKDALEILRNKTRSYGFSCSFEDLIEQILSLPEIDKGLQLYFAVHEGEVTIAEAIAKLREEERMAIMKGAGIAVLHPDQSLPKNVYKSPLDATQEKWRAIVAATQRQMVEAGWVRRVV